MRKDIAIGIVVALSIGVLVGYFVLPLLFPSEATDQRQTYFVTQKLERVQIQSYWTLIPNINISFTTLSGDEATFCYSCHLNVTRTTSDAETFNFLLSFVIDGVVVGDLEQLYLKFASNVTEISYSIIYRLVRTGWSAGPHELSIYIARNPSSPNSCWASSSVLSVQIS